MSSSGEHAFGIVETNDVHGVHFAKASVTKDEFEERAGSDRGFKMLRTEIVREQAYLRGQRAAIGKRKNEKSSEIVPPRV